MSEQRKAVIKNADMSEEMQQEAVDCASQALSKYNIEKVSFEDRMYTPDVQSFPNIFRSIEYMISFRLISLFHNCQTFELFE
jgi:methyl coenzyme M reductase gamma subunit